MLKHIYRVTYVLLLHLCINTYVFAIDVENLDLASAGSFYEGIEEAFEPTLDCVRAKNDLDVARQYIHAFYESYDQFQYDQALIIHELIDEKISSAREYADDEPTCPDVAQNITLEELAFLNHIRHNSIDIKRIPVRAIRENVIDNTLQALRENIQHLSDSASRINFLKDTIQHFIESKIEDDRAQILERYQAEWRDLEALQRIRIDEITNQSLNTVNTLNSERLRTEKERAYLALQDLINNLPTDLANVRSQDFIPEGTRTIIIDAKEQQDFSDTDTNGQELRFQKDESVVFGISGRWKANHVLASNRCLNAETARDQYTNFMGYYAFSARNTNNPYYQYGSSYRLSNSSGATFQSSVFCLNVEGVSSQYPLGSIRAKFTPDVSDEVIFMAIPGSRYVFDEPGKLAFDINDLPGEGRSEANDGTVHIELWKYGQLSHRTQLFEEFQNRDCDLVDGQQTNCGLKGFIKHIVYTDRADESIRQFIIDWMLRHNEFSENGTVNQTYFQLLYGVASKLLSIELQKKRVEEAELEYEKSQSYLTASTQIARILNNLYSEVNTLLNEHYNNLSDVNERQTNLIQANIILKRIELFIQERIFKKWESIVDKEMKLLVNAVNYVQRNTDQFDLEEKPISSDTHYDIRLTYGAYYNLQLARIRQRVQMREDQETFNYRRVDIKLNDLDFQRFQNWTHRVSVEQGISPPVESEDPSAITSLMDVFLSSIVPEYAFPRRTQHGRPLTPGYSIHVLPLTLSKEAIRELTSVRLGDQIVQDGIESMPNVRIIRSFVHLQESLLLSQPPTIRIARAPYSVMHQRSDEHSRYYHLDYSGVVYDEYMTAGYEEKIFSVGLPNTSPVYTEDIDPFVLAQREELIHQKAFYGCSLEGSYKLIFEGNTRLLEVLKEKGLTVSFIVEINQ